jgi:hypothetical protein
MSLAVIAAPVGGAICATAGQLLFAAGARGRTQLLSFLNISIMAGLGLYALYRYQGSIARIFTILGRRKSTISKPRRANLSRQYS